MGSSIKWATADFFAAVLVILLLGIHVIRKARGGRGRRPASAVIRIVGLPLLLLLPDVIHFWRF